MKEKSKYEWRKRVNKNEGKEEDAIEYTGKRRVENRIRERQERRKKEKSRKEGLDWDRQGENKQRRKDKRKLTD